MGSPSDQANLAPVDVREHSAWTTYVRSAFLGTLAPQIAGRRGVQGPNASGALSVGRIPLDQRKGITLATLETRPRSSMTPRPVSQALIRQVTGIGAVGTTTGR